MTTLTIRLSDEEKKTYKSHAALEGVSLTDYVLDSLRKRNQGTIYEAMKDLKEGRYEEYNSKKELFASFDSTWEEATNEV